MRAEFTTESRTESKKDITDRKDRSAEWWGTCGLLRTCKRPKGAVSGSATTLQRSADILGVLKLDRLSRSIKHFCEKYETYFKDGTKELVAIRESIRLGSSLGRTLVGILLVFAQMEREATGCGLVRSSTILGRVEITLGRCRMGSRRFRPTTIHG